MDRELLEAFCVENLGLILVGGALLFVMFITVIICIWIYVLS